MRIKQYKKAIEILNLLIQNNKRFFFIIKQVFIKNIEYDTAVIWIMIAKCYNFLQEDEIAIQYYEKGFLRKIF